MFIDVAVGNEYHVWISILSGTLPHLELVQERSTVRTGGTPERHQGPLTDKLFFSNIAAIYIFQRKFRDLNADLQPSAMMCSVSKIGKRGSELAFGYIFDQLLDRNVAGRNMACDL